MVYYCSDGQPDTAAQYSSPPPVCGRKQLSPWLGMQGVVGSGVEGEGARREKGSEEERRRRGEGEKERDGGWE